MDFFKDVFTYVTTNYNSLDVLLLGFCAHLGWQLRLEQAESKDIRDKMLEFHKTVMSAQLNELQELSKIKADLEQLHNGRDRK